MRISPFVGIAALGALKLAGAAVTGGCHRAGGNLEFRSESAQDLGTDFLSKSGVRIEPDDPALLVAPDLFVNQEARKVIKLRQGARVIFPGVRIDEEARHFLDAAQRQRLAALGYLGR